MVEEKVLVDILYAYAGNAAFRGLLFFSKKLLKWAIEVDPDNQNCLDLLERLEERRKDGETQLEEKFVPYIEKTENYEYIGITGSQEGSVWSDSDSHRRFYGTYKKLYDMVLNRDREELLRFGTRGSNPDLSGKSIFVDIPYKGRRKCYFGHNKNGRWNGSSKWDRLGNRIK